MTNQDTSLKKSPLDARHRALNAKMVPFAGWSMPVTYDGLGVMAEHEAVRSRAGLFDVSHMGEFLVDGPNSLAVLQNLVPNDVARLQMGGALYSPICNERGGIVDDCLIYRIGETRYMVVVNASNAAKDFAWFESHWGAGSTLTDISMETGLVAIQGPRAMGIVKRIIEGFDPSTLKSFTSAEASVAGVTARVSRTGYTGEDGAEIYVPWQHTEKVWDALLEAGRVDGIAPAGLGARDSTRLEACLPLYGNDIDDETNPLSAGIGWTVKLNKGTDFIGKGPIEKAKAEGLKQKLVGFVLRDPGIPRHGYPVCVEADGAAVSSVTSGTKSPTLGESIGLCYVPTEKAQVGGSVWVEIRGKKLRGEIVQTPFYKRK
jgi:aminomethyltransferase